MLQCVLRATGSDSYSHIARDEREHMRGALHEFLNIGHPLQRILNDAGIRLRYLCLTAQLLYVITVSCGTGHTPSGSMRLLQVARIHQIGHDITYGSWAKTLAAAARKHARPDRFARRNKSLDNGGQDFAFAVSDILTIRHISILPVLLLVPTYCKSTVTTWETAG